MAGDRLQNARPMRPKAGVSLTLGLVYAQVLRNRPSPIEFPRPDTGDPSASDKPSADGANVA